MTAARSIEEAVAPAIEAKGAAPAETGETQAFLRPPASLTGAVEQGVGEVDGRHPVRPRRPKQRAGSPQVAAGERSGRTSAALKPSEAPLQRPVVGNRSRGILAHLRQTAASRLLAEPEYAVGGHENPSSVTRRLSLGDRMTVVASQESRRFRQLDKRHSHSDSH